MAGSEFDAYAESMVMETVSETATTFFGARKALEDEIAFYRTKVKELGDIETKVLAIAGTLNYLLLGGESVREFYEHLGIDAGHLVDAPDISAREVTDISAPWAFTAGKRFGKLLLSVYTILGDRLAGYRHGVYYDDPGGSGRKCITVNYAQLEKWCTSINTKIENLNNNMSPSGTMCFIRGLDPVAMKQSRLTGATIDDYAAELDKELAFEPVECLTMNYLSPPDLLAPDEAVDRIVAFGVSLYARESARLKPLLEHWKNV